MTTILVLGSTGTVGAELSRLLVAKGHDVRGATRAAHHPVDGVRAVHFDYQDPETFAPVLQGVDRLFVLSPSGGFADAYALLSPFLQVALPEVERVVTMTAQGVDVDPGIPLRRVELEVEASGAPFIHLRPNWFLQNFHTFWGEGVRAHNSILLPAADARVGFVDTRDIAAAAAAALTTQDVSLLNAAYDLTGPQPLTHGEVAQGLTEVLGRSIRYEAISDDAFRGLAGGAMSPEYLELLLALFGALRAGAASSLSDGIERLTGRAPRSLLDYARDHRDALT